MRVHVAKAYQEELNLLDHKIAQMGGLTEHNLGRAFDALNNHDPQLAERVIMSDAEIDRLQAEIDNVRSALEWTRTREPGLHVRLSAGRTEMSDEMQALSFFAGANSIFYGEKLLTTGNPDVERDQRLFQRLGIQPV